MAFRSGQDNRLELSHPSGIHVPVGHDDDTVWGLIEHHLYDGPNERHSAWPQLLAAPMVNQTQRLLAEEVQFIESQLAIKKGELLKFQQKCLRQKIKGKDTWFKYKAEYESWRGETIARKQAITSRLMQCREVLNTHKLDLHLAAQRLDRETMRQSLIGIAREVKRHRMRTDTAVARAHDTALWAALHRYEITMGTQSLSLAQFLEDEDNK